MTPFSRLWRLYSDGRPKLTTAEQWRHWAARVEREEAEGKLPRKSPAQPQLDIQTILREGRY